MKLLHLVWDGARMIRTCSRRLSCYTRIGLVASPLASVRDDRESGDISEICLLTVVSTYAVLSFMAAAV